MKKGVHSLSYLCIGGTFMSRQKILKFNYKLSRAMKTGFVLLASLVVVKGDYFSEYLFDKTFGGNPGPCTEDDQCIGDFQNLPESVKKSPACFGSSGDTSKCGTLEELVKSGTYKIWDLRCEAVALGSSTATHTVNENFSFEFPPGTGSVARDVIKADITVNDMRLKCQFLLSFDNLVIELFDIFRIEISADDVDSTTDSTNPSEAGTKLVNTGYFIWDAADDYRDTLPNYVSFPVDQCTIVPNFGLTLDMPNSRPRKLKLCAWLFGAFRCADKDNFYWGLILNLFNWSSIVSGIANIIEGIIGNIACSIIAESGWLTQTDEPGYLNQLWDTIQADVIEIGASQPEDIDVSDSEAKMIEIAVNEMKYVESEFIALLANTTNLQNSSSAELISVGLNNWLGQPSRDPDYVGRLTVNEIIDSVLGNSQGLAQYDLSDMGIAPTLDVELSMTKATFTLNTVQLIGLNTITQMEILQNGYDNETQAFERYKRTMKNHLKFDAVAFRLGIGMRMSRGEWVTRSCALKDIDTGTYKEPNTYYQDSITPNCDQIDEDFEDYKFTVQLDIKGLTVDFATNLAINTDEIKELQVGQILDLDQSLEADGTYQTWYRLRRCISPAFYYIYLPSLSGSASALVNPIVGGFETSSGMRQLFDGLAGFVASATTGAVQSQLEGFMQGPTRKTINNSTYADFIQYGQLLRAGSDILPPCPAWIGNEDAAPERVDWKDGWGVKLYGLINAVGGDPINPNSANINDLVQVLVEYGEDKYLAGKSEFFPLSSISKAGTALEQGHWRVEESLQNIFYLAPYNASASDNFYLSKEQGIRFTDFELQHLNSITKLHAEYNSNLDGVQIRSKVDELLFQTVLELDNLPLASPTQQRWRFDLSLKGSNMDIVWNDIALNMYSIKALRFEQLSHIPCILQGVKRIVFSDSQRQVTLDSFDFDLVPLGFTPDGQYNNPLEAAIAELSSTVTTPTDIQLKTKRRFQALLNTILKGSLNYGLNWMEKVPILMFNVDNENCLDYTLPEIDLGRFALPNASIIAEECLLPVPDAPLAAEIFESSIEVGRNLGEAVDFQESELLSLLAGLINQGDTINQLMVSIANSTGTKYSDYFVFSDPNPANPVVDLVFPLKEAGFYFEDDIIVPGLQLDGGILRVAQINKLLGNVTMFNKIDNAKYTTRHHFNFPQGLDFQIEARMAVDGVSVGEVDTVTELLTFTFQAQKLSISLDTVSAINGTLFGDLSVGHMFTVMDDQTVLLSDEAFDCLFSTLYPGGVAVKNLFVEGLETLTGPTVTATQELVSPSVQNFIAALVTTAKDFYVDAFDNICYHCLASFLSKYLVDYQTSAVCPAAEKLVRIPLKKQNEVYRFNTAPDMLWFQEKYMNFTSDDYELLNVIAGSFLKNVLFANDVNAQGLSVSHTGNSIYYGGIPLLYDSVNYGTFSFSLSDTTITMDADEQRWFDSLTVLNPYFKNGSKPDTFGIIADSTIPEKNIPYMTRSELKMPGFKIEAFVELDFQNFFETLPNVENHLKLEIDIVDLYMLLDLYMEVNITKAMEMQFKSVASYDLIPCALVPIKALEPVNFIFNTTSFTLGGDCTDACDNIFPELKELVSGTGELSDLVNKGIEYIVDYVNSKGAQGFIDGYLASADGTCAELSGLVDSLTPPEQENDQVAIIMAYIFAGIMGLGGLVGLMLFPLHKKRRQNILGGTMDNAKELNGSEVAGILAIADLEMSSLFMHPMTNPGVKILVPIICAMNVVALIIAVFFSKAASIVVTFTVLDAQTPNIALVPFTIQSTIDDMWTSGAWPLAILIAVASVAWPIVKNILLLVFWFTPSTVLSVPRRKFWLEMFDLLGKWSFLDVFVIVVMLAALRTYVSASYFSFLPFIGDNTFATETSVAPEAGIIILCFVCATSLLINHVILHFHNRAFESNRVSRDKVNGIHESGKVPRRAAAPKALSRYMFNVRNKSGKVRIMTKPKAMVLIAAGVVSALLIIVGSLVPVVTFELRGLLGVLLQTIYDQGTPEVQALGPQNIKQYSLFQMGAVLSDAPTSSPGERFVLFIFQLLFFISVLIAPVFQLALLLVLFVLPMSLPKQKIALFWANIAMYWSALEVLLLGLVFTMIEIGPVTQFIVDFISNGLCSHIKAGLEILVEDPELDGFCLDIDGYFEATSVIIFLGLFLQLVVTMCINTFAHAAIDDRYYAAYRDTRSDIRPRKLNPLKVSLLAAITSSHTPVPGDDCWDLDNETDNLNVDVEDPQGCCSLCCNVQQAEGETNKRLALWQSRFGISAAEMDSVNPTFMDEPSSNKRESVEV